jgi:uncharacterized membrane protein YphA (DoxX/SURF4 family)
MDRRVIAALRVGLGVIFIVAALPKLQDPVGFSKSVSNYHLLPEIVERVLALVLPPMELLVGVCLIAGVVDAGASLITFVLMVVFTVAIGSALARGLDISCGCFDTDGGAKVGLSKIVENLVMTGAALAVWRGDRSWFSLGGLLTRAGDIE